MANTNDLPPQSTVAAPSPNAAALKNSPRSWLLITSIILASSAIMIAIIALWYLHKVTHHVRASQVLIATDLQDIKQKIATVDVNVNQFKQYTQTQFKNYDESITTLSSQRSQVNDVIWQLKKAYYLMQLAQFNLHWNHDLQGSLVLLQQADQLLKELELADLLTIRQTLSNEITQLTTIPVLDKLGLMSQFAAISQEIPKLALYNEHHTLSPNTVEVDNATVAHGNWRNALQRTWQELQKIIIIRQSDHPVPSLLSPQQRRLLDDRIILLMQQAQWALLQPDNGVYQLSIEQAIMAIEQNFARDSTKTSAILKKLQQLKQQDIAPQLPDIATSQLQLKQYIEHYHPEGT